MKDNDYTNIRAQASYAKGITNLDLLYMTEGVMRSKQTLLSFNFCSSWKCIHCYNYATMYTSTDHCTFCKRKAQ